MFSLINHVDRQFSTVVQDQNDGQFIIISAVFIGIDSIAIKAFAQLETKFQTPKFHITVVRYTSDLVKCSKISAAEQGRFVGQHWMDADVTPCVHCVCPSILFLRK